MLEIRHSNWAWTMDMQVLGPGVCLSTPGVCGHYPRGLHVYTPYIIVVIALKKTIDESHPSILHLMFIIKPSFRLQK